MATPQNRVPVRIARGAIADLNASVGDLYEGEICYSTDENRLYVKEGGVLVLAGIGTSVAVIDDLTDVDTTTAAPGASSLLTYDGVNWVPTSVANDNLEIGVNANNAITTGARNIGIGYHANQDNQTQNDCISIGYQASELNTGGNQNVVIGNGAMALTTNRSDCVAIGYNALNAANASLGTQNTIVGSKAAIVATTGEKNTIIGYNAGGRLASGSYNTFIGESAGHDPSGGQAGWSSGDGNICIGGRDATGAWNPVFASNTDNRIVMGSTAVTNAYIQVAWTAVSDERDKTNFGYVDHGLAFVNALKPVSYQFRKNRDSEEAHGPVRYGFKAQDILKIEGEENPVVVDNETPEKLRLRSDSLLPILVNAIQELSQQVSHLESRIRELES